MAQVEPSAKASKASESQFSDELFDKQMPFAPHFFDWPRSVHHATLEAYVDPQDDSRYVVVTRGQDRLIVQYFCEIDGMTLNHRVGGPATYYYRYDNRMTHLLFILFDQYYSEREYWTMLLDACKYFEGYSYKEIVKYMPLVNNETQKLIYAVSIKEIDDNVEMQIVSRSRFYKINEERFKGFI